ncbi:hypothetical protein QAD02_001280 [Eretmocerus hayati]|uniref:Uncharacterized protein n=1 Tax=Eretmocerus hayati TaxID=131215 RepID=A0ACC2NGI7_9HYME|nr:hypothetical protein QAD02_001280 [Eretmocerus hayati]
MCDVKFVSGTNWYTLVHGELGNRTRLPGGPMVDHIIRSVLPDMLCLPRVFDSSHMSLRGEEPLSEEKYASYKTLCRTSTCTLTDAVLQDKIRFCSSLLIGLAEPVLRTPYDPYQLKKLMKNDDAIFLGAFLLKLNIINSGRIHQVKCNDAHNDGCHKPTINLIVLSQLLIPLSCTPNVGFGHSYGNKCYIYAIEPIKEGTQLFSSLWLSSIYYNTPKAQRDLTWKSFYNFPCDCRACTENWCEKLYNPAKKEPMRKSKASIAKEIMSEMESIKREMKTGRLSRMKLVDNQLVYRIRNLIAKAWQKFPMPSHITFEAVKLMIQIFEMFFSYSPRLVYRKRAPPPVPIYTRIQKDGQ